MADLPRGALKPGTVGTLGSGRLVYVERVTPYAAFLISLPQQLIGGLGDEVRFTSTSKAYATSPFVDLTPVPFEQLSTLNQQFIRNGCQFPTPDQLPKPTPATKPEPVLKDGIIKRGGQKRLEAFGEVPDGLDHRELIVLNIIKELKQPMLEQVIQACLQHPKFQSPSSHRAARWFTNELIKKSLVRYVG